MARIIGITGGIGAGKSVVSRILRLKGYQVYDCDSEASRLMEDFPDLRSNLKERFGEECYDAHGKLNRKFLASRIFCDSGHRNWVNSLVHKTVREDIARRTEAAEGIFFIESAIMVTSRLDEMCDEIWLVDAPVGLRIERAVARGGSSEDISRRIGIQEREYECLPSGKTKVIDNGDGAALLPRIDSLLENLIIQVSQVPVNLKT